MKLSNRKGFTLVEIMIVVAIIGLLAAIAIPNFVRARTNAQTNACIANLKQIDGAKQLALLDGSGIAMGDLVPTYIKQTPTCPANGNYTVGDANTDPTCSVGGTHALP